MPKTKTYKTVAITSADKFDAAVNLLISEGWELYGNPYCVSMGSTTQVVGFFCQAMVKEAK